MGKGCWLQICNLTDYLKPKVTLLNTKDWAAYPNRTPTGLHESINALHGMGQCSSLVYVEVADGRKSAKFNIEFESKHGTVSTTVDVYPVVNGGQRKGQLKVTGGTAAQKYLILESQHDKQEWEQVDGRYLSIIVADKIDPKKWMSKLHPDFKLNELTIPGTHDSGTAPISGIRQCQSLSIAQQLNLGIRFLDIRLNKSRKWEIMHEDTGTGLYFTKDCLTPIKNFLNTNSEETVLLCIKDEHGSTDAFHDDVMKMLKNTLGSRVFTGQRPGKLGKSSDADTLRGKVVLMRRYWIDPKTNPVYGKNADSGIGLTEFKDASGNAQDFPDKSDTFDILKDDSKVFYQQPGGLPFAIQDWYDLQTRFQPDKIRVIAKYMRIAKSYFNETWFLNFASTTASGHAGDWPKNFAIGDDNINAAIFTYIASNSKGRYGVIPMDFVGNNPKDLVTLLISSNELRT